MHILVVNDDGPPCQVSSPYVHSFVYELQQKGHTVSVVLPHTQRSWIGKAHLVGKTVTPTYFRPGTLHVDDGSTTDRPRQDGGEEWILIDGTPASCAQIGIHHYFKERGDIDLVVSGPNYGRNSTAVFALSSGTIGGALEAAVSGKKAIALSFAFYDRNHDPVVIKGASLMGVKVVEHLAANWTEGVDFYSVNVPLLEGIEREETKVLYTNVLQNSWDTGSSFEEVEVEKVLSPEETEAEIREGAHGERDGGKKRAVYTHKKFKWAPKLDGAFASVERSEPGNDGWAVKNGHVSITPLMANFMHHPGDLIGQEVKLPQASSTTVSDEVTNLKNLTIEDEKTVYAVVDYDDETNYVQPKIVASLQKLCPGIKILKDATELPKKEGVKTLDWSSYEKLDFDSIMERPETVLSCSYVIRKALIRKHYLGQTLRHHVAKHPTSALAGAFPETCEFEVDYAEFLDEALMEAYELTDSLSKNEDLEPKDREWWILKPGMSDRGQGIRLFSSLGELTEIFEAWDPESDDEEDDENVGDENADICTSQLRHFVAQQYIHPPLLIDNTKFHIRTYVLAVGGLQVYVYRNMLALFAPLPYAAPGETTDLARHLTNTCLQTGDRVGTVREFWGLEKELGKSMVEGIWENLCKVVGETFEGAARGQRIHFQTLPNAFEIYGVDLMVGKDGSVYLLEVNAYPDFKQTGDELGELISGLFDGVVRTAVVPFFGGEREEDANMEKVLDIKMGGF